MENQSNINNQELLIVVRHGEYYSNTKDLTPVGIRQISGLGSKILPFVKGKTVGIIHAPAPRTTQSAEILAKVLGVNIITQLYELDPEQRYGDDDVILAIKEQKFNIVIAVTHDSYAEWLPCRFIKGYMKKKISHANAWLIDLKRLNVELIKPD